MFAELLRSKLAGISELSGVQIDLLGRHYGLLTRWNKVLNLTSVCELEEAVERHYCESIFVAAHLPPGDLSIADIGSGAGFPGFPIAVSRPDCQVTLIESHQRKAAFLKESSRQVANIRILSKRAEDVSETFDWAVSRAVRIRDIAGVLKKLAGKVELLTGEVHPSGLPGFAWQDPIRLPWGEHRYLWVGSNVSRETEA